jgi:hypothetical protein
MDRKKQQVPPLRFAPVGMTNSFKLDDFARKINKVTASRDDKWRVVTFMRDRQIGWTEKKQQVPFDFAQGRLSTSLRSGSTAGRDRRDDNFV